MFYDLFWDRYVYLLLAFPSQPGAAVRAISCPIGHMSSAGCAVPLFGSFSTIKEDQDDTENPRTPIEISTTRREPGITAKNN